MRALVAIHVAADDGRFVDDGACYDIAELGAMPTVGDRIVHPGSSGRSDRVVYEVVGRYFLGRQADHAAPRIALFVRAEVVIGESDSDQTPSA